MATVLAMLAADPARADEDQDQAYRARHRGEIVPLEEILALVRRSHPGTVLEIELERHRGRWIYEVELLRKDGVIAKIYLDATTKKPLPPERRREERTKEED
jgi:uncharacterized membrane protein YkoI